MKLRENELTTSQSDGRFSSVAIRPLHSNPRPRLSVSVMGMFQQPPRGVILILDLAESFRAKKWEP
jgi:hypothetical protein